MISVIIPTYNNSRFIACAIESVYAQTCGDCEIIVVDDGSTDGTRGVIDPYRDRITYILQQNRGPSAARNRGIRAARGEVITFLDADDLWLPDKLELQLAEAKRTSRPALVGCGLELIDAEGRMLGTLFKWRTDEEFRNQIGAWNVFGNPSCALTFKSVFDEVGYFNEKLRFGEDWDMWLRISRKYPVRLVPKALVKYRVYNGIKNYEDIEIQKACIKEIIGNFSGRERFLNQRKALSNLYTEMAWTSLQRGNRARSIGYAARAVLLNPFKIHQGDQKRLLLVRTLLPVPVLERLRAFKALVKPAGC